MKKLVLLLLTVSVFVWSCGEEESSVTTLADAKGGVFYGGVFKTNEVEDFRSLYPHNVTDAVSWRIISQVYQGLVHLDAKELKISPSIAERHEVNDNATRFTFFLRKNVYFHDDPCFPDKKGRQVTAHDFKYCFDRLCEGRADNQLYWMFENKVKGANEYYESFKNGSPLAEGVSGVKVIDDYTLEIELVQPFGSFLRILSTAAGWVFPKEAVEMYGEDMRTHAVGTGAFRLKTVKEGDVVILEKNPNYWDIDEHGNKLPYLDGVKITFMKEKKTELMEFRNENLHMVYKLPTESITDVLADLDEAKQGGNPPFQMQSTPIMATQYYGFLHASDIFSDPNVRKAFNLAIDRESIVTYTLRGKGIPAEQGIVPPSFSQYPSESVQGYTFNADEARKLLAEAGYPNGKGFPELTLQLNSGGKTNEQVAVALQNQFSENLGVKIEFNILPLNQHYERVETAKADFWRAGWLADYPDPENFLNILHSSHIPPELGDRAYLNPFRYRSTAFDSLYDLAAKEADEAKRMELLAQADNVAMADAAVLPIYYDEVIRLLDNSVQGCPINAMELRDFSLVYFKKEKEEAAAASE